MPSCVKSADVYSLACVFYYICTEDHHELYPECKKTLEHLETSLLDKWMQILFKPLIKDMTVEKASKRLNSNVILNHVFFWKPRRIFEFFHLIEKIKFLPPKVKKFLNQHIEIIVEDDWKNVLAEKGLNVDHNLNGRDVQDLIKCMCAKVSFLFLFKQILFIYCFQMKYFEEKFEDAEIKFEHLTKWLKTFPFLLPHLFHCFEKLSKNDFEASDCIKTAIRKVYHKKFGFSKPDYWTKTIDDKKVDAFQKNLQDVDYKPEDKSTWLDPLGRVVKGTFTQDDAKFNVAIKRLRKDPGRIKVELSNLLHACRGNENIVNFFGFFKTPTHTELIFEQCLGTLEDFIRKTDEYFSSVRSKLSKIEILRNVTQGLKFLHTLSPNEIAHRDLKPENILIRGENQFKACITDFGISKEIIDNTTITLTGRLRGTQVSFLFNSFC